MSGLRARTAFTGCAETRVGKVPGMGPTELAAEAACKAVADAGLAWTDIDGLVTCNSMARPHMYHAEMMAEYLQIHPRYCVTTAAGGGTTFSALHQAALAIDAGVCDHVLVTLADSMRTGLSREQAMALQSSTGHPEFEIPHGPTVPAYYALIARAHMHEYGTTPEQLAAVAVSCRAHAARNPAAEKRDPITVEDVLASRMIADPLHLLDCSLVSDGGAAVVLSSARHAAEGGHDPVYLLGAGAGHGHEHISAARSLTTSAAVESGRRAFAMAGLTPADMDLAQVYDCFTPVVLIELEDLGFCAKGEAGVLVAEGHTLPGGALPMNTNGGLLSCCHPGNPGSLFALTEAVTQLRHAAGERQVEGASTCLVHGQGGIMSSHATLILGREAG